MTKKAGIVLFCLAAQLTLYPQQPALTLKGTILDSKNEPIPYASIGIPAKGIGTISNLHGDFSLNIPAPITHDIVIISSLGYTANKIVFSTIDLPKPLIVRLTESHLVMEEVIFKASRPGSVDQNGHREYSSELLQWSAY